MKPKKTINPKLKKLVLDALRRHAWNMGCSFYEGDILYMNEPDHRGQDTMASMGVDPCYLKAILRIFPSAVQEWEKREKEKKGEGDKYMELVVAHEVAHIVTEPLYLKAVSVYKNEGETEDAREALTETIGRLSVALEKQLRKL